MVPDWEKRFQEGQTPWQRDTLHPTFSAWVEQGLLTPCRILIPGSGTCLELAEFARLGFDVVGLDISATAIEDQRGLLTEQGLEAELFHGDMFDWSTTEPFDAIYEQTCLCAIEPKQRLAYEVKLHEWLKPQGRLFALFMQTGKLGGPPYDCDLDAMADLFSKAEWDWQEEGQARADFQKLGAYEIGRVLTRL